jgi:hypothetical protein
MAGERNSDRQLSAPTKFAPPHTSLSCGTARRTREKFVSN